MEPEIFKMFCMAYLFITIPLIIFSFILGFKKGQKELIGSSLELMAKNLEKGK